MMSLVQGGGPPSDNNCCGTPCIFYTSESLCLTESGDTDHIMVGMETVSRLLRKESLSKLYISSQ
jgi:hypothetical protein